MNQVEVGRLLHQVAVRQHAAAVAGRFYAAVLVLAAAYLAVLMTSRLLGVIPDVFELRTLLVIPVGAALVAVLATRRGTAAAAARQVDTRMDTKDLFLTTALIDTAVPSSGGTGMTLPEAHTKSGAAVLTVPYTGSVSMGSLLSKMMVHMLSIVAPSCRSGELSMTKVTCPSPRPVVSLGYRNPSNWPVSGVR